MDRLLKIMVGMSVAVLIGISSAIAATNALVPETPQDTQASSIDRVQKFLQQQQSQLSTDFPYRVNLFTDGQKDQNSAGIRIAEVAKQLAENNSGLLFYYQLYNHSMRVPHWHANAVEVGTVLSGKMRVTIWEGQGKIKMFTVEKNGTWMIPQAALHALENVGPEKLTFFVAYNSPIAADRDFLTAWAALPDAILERAVGLTAAEVSTIKKTTVNRLSSYDPSAEPAKVDQFSPFSSNFATTKPVYKSSLGSIVRVDASVNTKMEKIALQQTILTPGTLRLPHWYTQADVLLYVDQGSGYFMMMNNAGKVYNVLVKPGDLISIPVGNYHSYLNIGKEDLVVYEAFNVAKNIQEISLLDGAQHFSAGALEGALGISKASAQRVVSQPDQSYMVGF